MIKTIKKNIILDNKFHTVENNKVLFNNKYEGFHLKIKSKTEGSVVVLPFDSEGNAYIQEEYRYGISDYIITIVAGGIKKGQSPEDAANAELSEEMGLKTKKLLKIKTVQSPPDVYNSETHIFVAIDCFKDDNKQEKDISESFRNKRKVKFENLLNMILNDEIKCHMTTMAAFTYFYYLKNK